MVGACVIMVVEGGIGNTVDRMNMSLALFREQQVPIIGVIVNKVEEDKLDKIKYYLGKALRNKGLIMLGAMPYDKTLGYPIMRSIEEAIDGSTMYNEHKMENKVEDILAGSLMDVEQLKSDKGLLLVVSKGRVNEALERIRMISIQNGLTETPLTGIVATGEGVINEDSYSYIIENQIPVLSTQLDTYGSVIKISRIEVKINLNTPWKVQRSIELIQQNIDLDFILNYCKL